MGSACWEDYLKEVTEWVAKHPFDVVTILFGNSNWADTDANGKPLDSLTHRNRLGHIARSALEHPSLQ